MAKGVYRDSIAQCNLYSNPYDTRMQSHPSLIRQRQQNYMKAQDTLSSSQSRLEKEIFLKLQASIKLPKGKFLLVAKLGKYAFLAIMLPPYIFCYGIPKWLLTEGLPKFYDVTARFIRRISDKVSDVAHKFVNALKTFGRKITSPILTFIQTRIEKTRELFARVREHTLNLLGKPFRFVNQKVIEPFSKMFARIQEGFGKIAKAYQNLSGKINGLREGIRHFFIYLPNNFKAKCVELLGKMQNKFSNLMPLIKGPFMPMINWASKTAATVTNFYNKTAEAIKQRVNAVLDRVIYRPLQKVKNFADATLNKAKEMIDSVTRPVIQWIDPKLEALKKSWQKTKDKFNDFKELSKEKAKDTWKALSDRVENSVKAASKIVVNMAHNIAQIIPLPVLSLFTPLAAFIAAPFNYRKTQSVLKAYMKKVREKIHSGLRNASKWIAKAQVAGRKLLKTVVRKLKTVPLKLFNLLKLIVLFILTALKGAILIFRLMLAWLTALFRYGMLLVKDMTSNLLYSTK